MRLLRDRSRQTRQELQEGPLKPGGAIAPLRVYETAGHEALGHRGGVVP